MNIKTFIFALSLILSPLTALAGGGHDHGHGHSHGPALISQSQAESVAAGRVMMLVEQEKVDKSWGAATIASAEKKMNGDQAEWLITFKNSHSSDSAKDTLYIFLSSTGDYIAANFTGK
ncbi:hypothetical protein Ga0123461_1746 [Mariprofundus aestuarium]|uniref:Uncharacterized protein n=1 Tax=Mariprofundus aestuarium TaxID=1921086 RepID=A0A2K8L1R4_MARES|nr:DUF6488 family protein [Mariprofundus aestuarium]ATX80159.1 hypothetical protein Ga0123461_1746 [Mariprofundus aestuarium]